MFPSFPTTYLMIAHKFYGAKIVREIAQKHQQWHEEASKCFQINYLYLLVCCFMSATIIIIIKSLATYILVCGFLDEYTKKTCRNMSCTRKKEKHTSTYQSEVTPQPWVECFKWVQKPYFKIASIIIVMKCHTHACEGDLGALSCSGNPRILSSMSFMWN